VDALYVRVRRHGAVRSTAVLLAVGINEEGQREILGLDVACGETRETWQDFFRSLRARGLRGVDYVTSDAHEGLRQALERTFPGVVRRCDIAQQRCQAHFMRNVLGKTPPSSQEAMHTHLCRILHADTPQAARVALEEAQSALGGQADRAPRVPDGGL
jgi:transposase-like protein